MSDLWSWRSQTSFTVIEQMIKKSNGYTYRQRLVMFEKTGRGTLVEDRIPSFFLRLSPCKDVDVG
jgi:hypothetical protein